MKFKINQELVCTNGSGWHTKNFITIFGFELTRRKKEVGPKKDEIVTADGYNSTGYLFLKEYNIIQNGIRNAYDPTAFQPVVPAETIEELMNSLQEQL